MLIRKTLLIISLVLLVGTVGMWVRSYWVHEEFQWGSPALSFSVSWCVGTIGVDTVPVGMRGFTHFAAPVDPGWGGAVWNPRTDEHLLWHVATLQPRGRFFSAQLPAWMPPLVLAIVTYTLVRPLIRHSHHRRHNLCVRCGYDLRGNVSEVCPECGTPSRESAPNETGEGP